MNWLDTALLIVVVLFFVRGIFRGLIKEILSLVALVAGAWLASEYHGLLSPYLERFFSGETVLKAASYLIIFVGTIVVFWLIAKLINALLDVSLLGWLDRTLGGIFGLLEGVLISLVALLLLQSFMPRAEFLQQSWSAKHAQPLVELLADFTPDSLRDTLKSTGFDLPSAGEVKEAVGLDSDG